MAIVRWSAGIDSVSGALQKPSKNSQHSCNQMLLATHRTAATTSNECNRLYLRDKVQRSTPLTEKELEVRNRFRGISDGAWARNGLVQGERWPRGFLGTTRDWHQDHESMVLGCLRQGVRRRECVIVSLQVAKRREPLIHAAPFVVYIANQPIA